MFLFEFPEHPFHHPPSLPKAKKLKEKKKKQEDVSSVLFYE